MRDNLSPEEKLLRLIRGEDNLLPAKEVASGVPAQASKSQAITFKRLSSLKGLRNLGIKEIIALTFFAVLIYLLFTFIYPLFYLQQIRLPQVSVAESSLLPQRAEAFNREPLEYYLAAIAGQHIFSAQSEETQDSAPAALEAEVIKDIALVGIISGVNPQAIVENKKLGKTYYLKRGQAVGELEIEDIQEGKIIVKHKGQKFELYL
jgi:hypothetical protein